MDPRPRHARRPAKRRLPSSGGAQYGTDSPKRTAKAVMSESEFFARASPITMIMEANPKQANNGAVGWHARMSRRVGLRFVTDTKFVARVTDETVTLQSLAPLKLALKLDPQRLGQTFGWATTGTGQENGVAFRYTCQALVRNYVFRRAKSVDDTSTYDLDEAEKSFSQSPAITPQQPRNVRGARRVQYVSADKSRFAGATDNSEHRQSRRPDSIPHRRDGESSSRSVPRQDGSALRRRRFDRTHSPSRAGRGDHDNSRSVATEESPHRDRSQSPMTFETPSPPRRRESTSTANTPDSQLMSPSFIDADSVRGLPEIPDDDIDDETESLDVWNISVHFLIMIFLSSLGLLVSLHFVTLLNRFEKFLTS